MIEQIPIAPTSVDEADVVLPPLSLVEVVTEMKSGRISASPLCKFLYV